MKALTKPLNFLKEVRIQLTKVSWPTREELVGATLVVISVTFLTVVFIGVVDLALSRILSWVFR